MRGCVEWLYFIEYRTYRVDHTRQRLFKVRDDLFKKAEEGIVPFDSRAYGIARTTLNGMIRFAHDLSFLRILIILFTYKKIDQGEHAKRYHEEMCEAINALPRPARKAILEAQLNMHLVLLVHVVRSSIILMVLLEPLRILLGVLHRWHMSRAQRCAGATSDDVRDTRVRQVLRSKAGRATLNIVDAEAKEIGDDLAIAVFVNIVVASTYAA